MTNEKERPGKRGRKVVLAAIGGVLVLVVAAFALYVGDYYRADPSVASALQSTYVNAESTPDPSDTNSGINVYELDHLDDLAFVPVDPRAGLIFYPGGKVEFTAYAPLARALAERGIICVIAQMPFNLAVFDVDAADAIRERLPDVDWYMGGHSLGGSMAASYVADQAARYEGLVLLASYSTEDVGASGLKVLSVYGTNDCVLDAQKYEQYRPNLGEDLDEVVIEGGNHAQFGAYGPQDGDGEAGISAAEQLAQTVDAIEAFML